MPLVSPFVLEKDIHGHGPRGKREAVVSCFLATVPGSKHSLYYFILGIGKYRTCLVSTGLSKILVTSNVWTHIWSIKYRLITKLIVQFATNLRYEFFVLQ